MLLLKNTRVGTRILLLILAVAVLLGVASWRGLWGVVSIADRVGAINEAESYVSASVSRIRSGRLEQELEVERALVHVKSGIDSRVDQVDVIRDARRRFARLSGAIDAEFDRAIAVVTRLEAADFGRDLDRIVNELLQRTLAARKRQQEYVDTVDAAFASLARGDIGEAVPVLETAGASAAEMESLFATAQKASVQARELALSFAEARSRVVFEVMVVYILALGLAMLFGLYLRSSIIVPLRSAAKVADRLAGGDRSVDVEQLRKAAGNDEPGQVLRALAKTVTAVRETEDLLERERRFAETIVETAPLPLLVASGDLEVRVANEAYCAVFAVRREEAEGRLLFDVNEGFWSRSEVRDQLMRVVRGEEPFASIQVTHEFSRLGKRAFVISARRVWRRRGLDENLILINVLDNTERMLAEEELIHARELALEASEAKSRFLATMSHEIRTPLNAIIGMADLLAETDLSDDQKRYVRIFERAGNSLLNLINDILDLSKVEIGELRIDRVGVELLQLVEGASELLALKAHEKGLELTLDIDPDVPDQVYADPVRIRQVLLNLLGNAIKFTENGEVTLRVMVKDASDPTAPLIRFEVKDTGIGIAGEKIAGIFESFRQGDASTTRKYGGTGLGLAISKALVEKMGGRLDVRSREGMGTVIGFEVPLERVPASRGDQQAADAGRFRGMSVLVGAPSASTRAVLRRMLDFWGVRVVEGTTVEEILECAEEHGAAGSPFDFTLVDAALLSSPESDGGVEADERLERLRNVGRSKIFLLVAEEGFRGTSALRRGDIDGFIPKPVKRGELLEILSEFSTSEAVPSGASPEERSASAPKLSPRVPYRVLVAEDAPDNQIVVTAYLKDEPIELDIVDNGKEAVEKFKSAVPGYDLVLMDIEMPVMDGYRATREIRQWEISRGEPRTPIVALTAYAMKREREMCMRSGCSDYLAKPLKKMTLVNKVAAILGPRRPKADAESTGESYVADHSQETEAQPDPSQRDKSLLTETEVEPELLDLIPGYLDNRRKDVTALEAALNSRDFVVIERIGHRMKGNGPTYGFTTLGRIGLTLERAAATQDEGSIRHSIHEMREFLEHRQLG